MALPKTVGTCADKLYALDQELKELSKEYKARTDKLKEKRTELYEHTLGLLNTQKSSGAAGKVGKVTKKISEAPIVEDFDALKKHIKKTGDFDLLQKSLSGPAVRERWEAGQKIPGIGKFQQVKLSITKA